jgi:hypothetical protein
MGACDKEGKGGKVIVMVIRWWVMKRVRATKRAMALTTRVEFNKESDGFGGKSDGHKGGNNELTNSA